MKSCFLLSFSFDFYRKGILVFVVDFTLLLLVDAVVTSSKRIHYSNCKECVNNSNDNDDGMIFRVFKGLIYAV